MKGTSTGRQCEEDPPFGYQNLSDGDQIGSMVIRNAYIVNIHIPRSLFIIPLRSIPSTITRTSPSISLIPRNRTTDCFCISSLSALSMFMAEACPRSVSVRLRIQARQGWNLTITTASRGINLRSITNSFDRSRWRTMSFARKRKVIWRREYTPKASWIQRRRTEFHVSIILMPAKIDVKNCFNASQSIKTESLNWCANSTLRKVQAMISPHPDWRNQR